MGSECKVLALARGSNNSWSIECGEYNVAFDLAVEKDKTPVYCPLCGNDLEQLEDNTEP